VLGQPAPLPPLPRPMRSHRGHETPFIGVINAVLSLLSPVGLFLDKFYAGADSTDPTVPQQVIARWVATG
jgi:hypothetical protein